MSSTCLSQGFIWSVNLPINTCSRCTMKITASTGPKGEPIATPLHYWYYYIFLHKRRGSFISFLIMFACFSLLLYIDFNIRLIVKSTNTFVNSDFASNDLSSWSYGFVIFFILLIDSRLLSTLYSDVLNADSILAKYFAGWFEAVPIFKIIACKGKSLTVPFTGI